MHGAALEGAAYAVDAVVGRLGREALERLDDVLVLLDDQVVGSVFVIRCQRLYLHWQK